MGWLVLLCAVLLVLCVPALAADDVPAAPPPPPPPALDPPAGAAPPVGLAPVPGSPDEDADEDEDAEEEDEDDEGEEESDDDEEDEEEDDDADEDEEEDEEEEEADEVIEPPIFVGDKRLNLTTDAKRHRFWPWSGSVRGRYRLRATSDASDNDVFGNLFLRYRDENMKGFSGSMHGRMTVDMDYFANTKGFYVFDSITDTWSSRVNPLLYHAHVNYRPGGGPVEYARVGRQYVDAGDYFSFDGLLVTTDPTYAPNNLRVTAFGGIPTHLYEGSIDGDAMGGLSIEGTPWRGGDARLDYVHFEDENAYYGQVTNDLFTLSLRQRVAAYTNAHAIYKHLNGDPHRLNLAVNHYDTRRDIVATGYFRTLLNAQTQSVYDIDPYVAVAQDYQPYWDAHLAVSKGFGNDRYNAEIGTTIRQLWDQSDYGRWNREWVRYYATFSTYDVFTENLVLSLTGEGWNTTGGGTYDDNTYTVTFDLDYRPSEYWRFKFGTDYAAYRTDFYFDRETIDSYRFFAGARWKQNQTLTWDLLMSYEWDNFDEYFGLRAAFNIDF